MAIFTDLPVELLPLVFDFVIKPYHLAQCCLVNKTFTSFAIPQLYKRIYIYAWHKDGKIKVRNLFRTLAEHPELAKWVQKLELRDFPKVFSVVERHVLTQLCVAGLNNCLGLHTCTWTRDQTINSEILVALKNRPLLRELEINGHSTTYAPELLLNFTSLTKISIIMPSAEVIAVLPTWLARTAESLESLQIICKSSGLISDQTLLGIAPAITKLKHLHLIGCIKVTHKGIGALLNFNEAKLESLGLEGLSHSFEMNELSQYSKTLMNLKSITLTIPVMPISQRWATEFLSFTQHSPLTRIHIYHTNFGGNWKAQSIDTHNFIESLLMIHGSRLQTLSVNRLNLTPQTIDMICSRCPHLQNLFTVVYPSELDDIIPPLSKSKSLRNVHINFPHISNFVGRLPPDRVLRIVKSIGPQIRQIGFANRVYQIDRVSRLNESNEVVVDVILGPYEPPEVPEQFLVVKL